MKVNQILTELNYIQENTDSILALLIDGQTHVAVTRYRSAAWLTQKLIDKLLEEGVTKDEENI